MQGEWGEKSPTLEGVIEGKSGKQQSCRGPRSPLRHRTGRRAQLLELELVAGCSNVRAAAVPYNPIPRPVVYSKCAIAKLTLVKRV